MGQITLKHLEAFVAVADLGSFRRAADRLNTTQPNISARIAQLETQVRLVLMERDAGSVRLTARGQSLLAQARAVLGGVDDFLDLAGNGALHSGALRLGVSEMVAHTWLHPFLRAFRAQFPGIDVELTVDLSAALSAALFDRSLDLVFQNGPFDRQAAATCALGDAAWVWVAAPSLGLHGRALTAADFAAFPVLTHARATAPYRQLDGHFRACGLPARLIPASNTATCLHMAQDGFGIACLPAPMAAEALENGSLCALTYAWTPAPLAFAARHLADPAPAPIRGAVALAQTLARSFSPPRIHAPDASPGPAAAP